MRSEAMLTQAADHSEGGLGSLRRYEGWRDACVGAVAIAFSLVLTFPLRPFSVRGSWTRPSLFWPRRPRAATTAEPTSRRRVQLDARQAAELPVCRFTTLAPEHRLEGPAIVEYPGSTLFVPPGWTLRYDEFTNAHLQRRRQ
jgi:hypothetical protein